MNLPQFTAGVAFYRSRRVYREYGAPAEMDLVHPGNESLVSPSTSCYPGGPNCPDEYVCCKGICYEPDSAPANCQSASGGCPHPLVMCDGMCTDLQYDSLNCTACGRKCVFPPNSDNIGFCCNGECIEAFTDENCAGCGASCPPGSSCCSGSCLDLQTDQSNCGGCGKVCPGGKTCCSGNCTSLNANNNCGACGKECVNGQSCVDGRCLCPDGQSSLTTTTDCGVCGNRCQAGATCCNGQCANFNTNVQNCGQCGQVCQNACFDGCCVNSIPSLTSNNTQNTNYWLSASDGCQNITGLIVGIQVFNFSVASSFSLQLNAIPAPNSQNITWMQYMIRINGGEIDADVEYWNTQNGCIVFTNQYLNVSCCANGTCCSGWDSFWDPIFGGICQTVLADTPPSPLSVVFYITLSTNESNGNVTEANFFMFGPNAGEQQGGGVPIPGNLQVPIQSFQLVVVGLSGCANTQFPSGGTGAISYSAAQELCVDGAQPKCPPVASYSGQTCETSNVTYGNMNVCCGDMLSQTLTT